MNRNIIALNQRFLLTRGKNLSVPESILDSWTAHCASMTSLYKSAMPVLNTASAPCWERIGPNATQEHAQGRQTLGIIRGLRAKDHEKRTDSGSLDLGYLKYGMKRFSVGLPVFASFIRPSKCLSISSVDKKSNPSAAILVSPNTSVSESRSVAQRSSWIWIDYRSTGTHGFPLNS